MKIMKNESRELVDMLQEQILVEENIVGSLDSSIGICQNTAVKCLLHGLQLDSLEHIDMCKAIIDMLSDKAVTSVEREDVRKMLSEHAMLEEKALKNIRKAVDKAPTPTIRMLLKNLTLDEERHHRSIEQITGIKAPMNNREMWDMILSTFWEFI